MKYGLDLRLAELKTDHFHVTVEVHVEQLGDEEDVLVGEEEVDEFEGVLVVRKVQKYLGLPYDVLKHLRVQFVPFKYFYGHILIRVPVHGIPYLRVHALVKRFTYVVELPYVAVGDQKLPEFLALDLLGKLSVLLPFFENNAI